ncbi:hypothetical protein F3Y22_tig00110279pilonHSYRG00066 [Hibiscus syriacus]|uniref:NmrA-like domain-containing protein n=1 Tax=Hibiscus syriacus TaxID=106335 RepID=A0A6A3B9Y8_HIBSY|nr:hypothetical protein F3Y22_tig00110279pilonHSYRG00066 [Hibiscus syriacus]
MPAPLPHKIILHDEFRSLGVTVIEGELDDHEKIVATLRRVDIVISSLPFPQVPDQIHIIEAIKVADEEREDMIIYGSGEAKVLYNYEEVIAEYTIKVENDLRTCNRIVHYRTPENVLSQIEIVFLWETKTDLPFPDNVPASILHSIFVKGDLNYDLGEDDLETSSLYPDYKYTMDQLLDIFLVDPPKPALAAF